MPEAVATPPAGLKADPPRHSAGPSSAASTVACSERLLVHKDSLPSRDLLLLLVSLFIIKVVLGFAVLALTLPGMCEHTGRCTCTVGGSTAGSALAE